jgi:glucose-6-phosphate dehydrogenase assembly protein OpcA
MQRQDIEKIIRELFRQYYNANEGQSFPIENGLMSEEGTINAQEVAKGYWAERNEEEVERDEQAGITEIDYVEWVMAELSDLIPNAN